MTTFLETIEKRRLILSSSLLFLIVFAFVILKSARDALFLSHYSSRSLPYFMALNTAVGALAATAAIRLYKRISLKRLVQFSLLFFSAGTILLGEGIIRSHQFLPGVLYLWVGIFGTIAPVQGWSLVSQQFSTRQAKRVMGIAGAGATLGAVAGGLFARLFAGTWGAITLIPVAGWVILVASLACTSLPPSVSNEEPSVSTDPEKLPVRKRFLILLAALVALGTVVSACIDFQFKTLTQQQFGSAEDLARFFGSFYAYAGLMTLFLQIVVLPALLRRFGVSASLVVLPVCLLLLNGVLLATGLFAVGVSVRGGDEVLKHSVGRSSLEVLYIAIPERARIRLKTLIDTIAVRVPELLASGMLILLFSYSNLPLQFVTLFNTGFLLLCFLIAWQLGRVEYPLMLKEQIERKELDFRAVQEDLFTGEFYRMLPELFRNAEKEVVLGLLDLLETSKKRWLGRYLLVSLAREDPEIRLKSLRLLFDQDTNLSHQVKSLCADKDTGIRSEATHYLCLRARLTKAMLQKLASDPDPVVRAAYCACEIRSKELYESGYRRMEALMDESVPQSRLEVSKEISHVLEYSKPSACAVPLYNRLLADPSDEVRKAALKSIARTTPPGVIPGLLSLSRHPALKLEVRAALAGYGESLIPLLAKIAENSHESASRRKLAMDVASDIGEQSFDLLLRMAKHEDLFLRFSAIKALNRLKKSNSLPDASAALTPLLRTEIQSLEFDLRRALILAPEPGSITDRVLRQRASWTFERIFRLLGLLHDPDAVYFAYLAWNSPDIRRADTAVELLDQILEPEIREKLFPLLEAYSMRKRGPADETERKKEFFACLRESEPMLVSAAICDLRQQELCEWEFEIREALPVPTHPLIQEIIHWRYTTMKLENDWANNDPPLTTIQKMEHLSKIDMFSKLGTQELLQLADLAAELRFEAGESVHAEGQIPSFLSLCSGEMQLLRSGEPIALVRVGESTGLQELLTHQTLTFSCVAIVPSVCLRIDRDSFEEVLENHTSVCRGILEVLAQKIDLRLELCPAANDPSPAC